MTPEPLRASPVVESVTDPAGACPEDFRRRAETLALERAGEMAGNLEPLSAEAARRALHELRVHQIELELQNEELRRTQAELEVSRERYFDLYDLAPVGYFTLDEAGLILEANLTATKLLGVTRAALVNRPLSQFVLPEDQDVYYLHRKAILETGVSQIGEMRLLNRDGVPFWVRVQASTAVDAEGMRLYRVVVSDITENKRAERAMQMASADLRDFAYALTHDLREPLRTVLLFTQLLEQELAGSLSEDAARYIALSVEGGMRMDALLKGLIDYWGITDRSEDSLSPVDCNRLLAQALSSLTVSIQQSGATVTSDPLPTLTSEEGMLTQLFQNLVGNAIKYRSEAPPQIHISAVKTAEGWLFSVRDNGIGIAPADAEWVFGMFKRLHGKEIPGTGIGLALCRKVVERHGGRIWVESEAGRGSTFKFTISAAGPR
jgi:two-component system, chemotaxis family, sensor kinase Cph1